MPILTRNRALQFIVLLGVVSLYADMTYEGARSISGQYLAVLGASGTVVGIVAGFGELLGYSFRLVSGYMSDRTQKYWPITFIGYFLNLFAVPLLAFASNWPTAAFLMILERFGRAIRSPAKDAMLSFASKEIGRGLGFGIHEAMDQIGAIIGPLIVSSILFYHGSYQTSFAVLIIPAMCAIAVLFVAKKLFPDPQKLEIEIFEPKQEKFPKAYWLYVISLSCVAAGFVDFALIAYHFQKKAFISPFWIPIFFSVAMGAAGIAALVCGRLYDKIGLSVLIFITAICSLFTPFVFLGGIFLSFIGMILWGISLGAHESMMLAVAANMVQPAKRGTAFGILSIWFGVFWFLGSSLMGYLYDTSLISLIIFSVAMQLIAIPFLYIVKQQQQI